MNTRLQPPPTSLPLVRAASVVNEAMTLKDLWRGLDGIIKALSPDLGYTVGIYQHEEAPLVVLSSDVISVPPFREVVLLPATERVADSLQVGPSSVFSGGRQYEVGASVPLVVQGQVLGVLFLHTDGDFRNVPDAEFWSNLGSLLGPALFRTQLFDATSQDSQRFEQQLLAIQTISGLLHIMELDRLLARLMDSAMRLVYAQAGSLALWRDERLETRIEWGLSDQVLAEMRLKDGEPIARHVARTGQALYVPETTHDDRTAFGDLAARAVSCLCVPLVTGKGTLGVITLVKGDAKDTFSRGHLEVLQRISSLAAIAINNAILAEAVREQERLAEQMQMARRIQQNLLPGRPTAPVGFELAAWSVCCDETGGDYHDFLPLANENLALLVGDVSGHGIGAALLMATARAFVRALTIGSEDLSLIMRQLNQLLALDMADNQFMTMLLGVFNPLASCFRFTTAGHNPPLHYSAARDTFTKFAYGGIPLGMLPESNYDKILTCELAPGDVLVLFTDGVTEACNPRGEEFGMDRLTGAIRRHRGDGAEEFLRALAEAVQAFQAGQPREDDMTVVALKRQAR